jgi:hypothetical protein
MGIFDRLFGRGALKIPIRHRSAAYMNLAYGIVPTAADAVGAWDTPPTPIEDITDEKLDTHFCTQDGINAAANLTWLQIDLGQEFEVYEIVIHNRSGEGFNQAAAAAANIDVNLITGVTGETATTGDVRDTQEVGHAGAWEDSTLHYVGEGISVRYVWIAFTPDGANDMNVDLSEIEVFGC